jgi:hypothetical protein
MMLASRIPEFMTRIHQLIHAQLRQVVSARFRITSTGAGTRQLAAFAARVLSFPIFALPAGRKGLRTVVPFGRDPGEPLAYVLGY